MSGASPSSTWWRRTASNRRAPRAGRIGLKLSLQDNRLVFDIDGQDFTRTYAISLTPLKGVLKDYLLICDSYYEASAGIVAQPDRIGRYGPSRPAQRRRRSS